MRRMRCLNAPCVHTCGECASCIDACGGVDVCVGYVAKSVMRCLVGCVVSMHYALTPAANVHALYINACGGVDACVGCIAKNVMCCASTHASAFIRETDALLK